MKYIVLTIMILFMFMTNINAQNPTKDSVIKLYVATFNRAPDSTGLNYWLTKSNLTLEQIAMSFFDQSETQKLYPVGTSTESFIDAIYNNLFQRATDSEGANYWKKDLESGRVSKSVFILAVVNGAKGDDATLLANKTEVGLKFVDSGSDDVVKAKSIMSKITKDDTTVNDALADIANFSTTEDSKEPKEIETPNLSINTNTGTSTSTGSTTTSPKATTSSGGSSSSTTTPTKEADIAEIIDDDELLPTF